MPYRMVSYKKTSNGLEQKLEQQPEQLQYYQNDK